ncbi:hypothetical protein [Vibrio sinaloensis]|uniref:hypothetical protein n=1 Tax=Photobacterium sp. (strain ATCC 43367) TaxID=379097 RepID=UPI002046B799|nr:hypothetical protein [Vibrio sinaloensis]UPQ89456.1 hypothetical protein MTO69_16995 [Vibrio sinaloensis]
MHLIDPKDKTQLWIVEDLGIEVRVKRVLESSDQQEQRLSREAVCRLFEYESWEALCRAKVKTATYQGWVGFGYRRSAYTTWLVYAYLRQHHLWRAQIDDIVRFSSQFSQHHEGSELASSSHDQLTQQVKKIGEKAFVGVHSFSSYADIEMTNWRELASNWKLDK